MSRIKQIKRNLTEKEKLIVTALIELDSLDNTPDNYYDRWKAGRDVNSFRRAMRIGKNAEYAVKQGVEPESFEKIPKSKREIAYSRFANAPETLKMAINEIAKHMEFSVIRGTDSFYGSEPKQIYLGNYLDDKFFADTFAHEFGHMVDDYMGVNVDNKFGMAFVMDTAKFAYTGGMPQSVYEDLDKVFKVEVKVPFWKMNKEVEDKTYHPRRYSVKYYRPVSDIISAADNNMGPVRAYIENRLGGSVFEHTSEYWGQELSKSKCKEVFANMFALYSLGEEDEGFKFIKRYFPRCCKEFEKLMHLDVEMTPEMAAEYKQLLVERGSMYDKARAQWLNHSNETSKAEEKPQKSLNELLEHYNKERNKNRVERGIPMTHNIIRNQATR